MGRRERPLDPGPLRDFAHDLRQLRATSGLTYRVMAEKAKYSTSALSLAASSREFPSLAVTRAYVGACGGDVAAWERRWHVLATWLRENSLENTSVEMERDVRPSVDEVAPEPRPAQEPGPAPRLAPILASATAPVTRPSPRHAREPLADREPLAEHGPGHAREPLAGRDRIPSVGRHRRAEPRLSGGERVTPSRPPEVLSAPTRELRWPHRHDAPSGPPSRPHTLPSGRGRAGQDRIRRAPAEPHPRDRVTPQRGAAGFEERGRAPGTRTKPPPERSSAADPLRPASATRQIAGRMTTAELPAVRTLADGDPRGVGQIRFAARLGEGPVGRLYLGRDGDGLPVAVRVIHPGLAGNRDFRIRLAREIEAIRAVSGPYLSRLTGGDPDGDPAWLAEAYVPAISLREAIVTLGPMGPETVRRLAAGITRALRDVHAVNVVHHRLTPENVLLTEKGPLVVDFGMAAVVDRSSLSAGDTRPQRSAFLAPEQVEGGPVGMAADVFALGGLLAYALTGSPPFGDDHPHAVMARIIRGTPDLTAVAFFDGHLAGLIAACLDKDPLARPKLTEIQARVGSCPPGEGWLPAPLIDLVRHRAAEVDAALRRLPPDPVGNKKPVQDDGRHRIRSAVRSAAHALRATEKATTSAQRRHHRRGSRRAAPSFWLAPLILTLAIVTLSAIVSVSQSMITLNPAPTPHPRHSTGQSAAGGRQPGGSTLATGAPGSAGQQQKSPQPQKTNQPQPSRSQSPHARPSQARPPQARQPTATFEATAGPFCPRTRSTSLSATSNPDGVGWYVATAARPTKDGCGNRFIFTPLAGSSAPSKLGQNHFDWEFRTGRAAPYCTLSFFVPFSDLANSDAIIWISNGSREASYKPAYRIASFTVNQADNRGQWFSVGPFRFQGGTVFAELTNTGQGPYGGTVVASAARATCKGLPG